MVDTHILVQGFGNKMMTIGQKQVWIHSFPFLFIQIIIMNSFNIAQNYDEVSILYNMNKLNLKSIISFLPVNY